MKVMIKISILFHFFFLSTIYAVVCVTESNHKPDIAQYSVHTNRSYLYPDFFRGRFSVEGEPILNYPVNVTFSIQPIKDMPNTKVRLLLPEGIEAEWTAPLRLDTKG